MPDDDYLNIIAATGVMRTLRFRDDVLDLPDKQFVDDNFLKSQPVEMSHKVFNMYVEANGTLVIVYDE